MTPGPTTTRPKTCCASACSLLRCSPCSAYTGYQAYNHYVCGNSLVIHNPVPELSTAENFLHILRPDSRYTALEAERAGPRPCAACRARRRQQLQLYHAGGYLVGHRHLFHHCGGPGQPERPQARRRQREGGAHVRRYEAAPHRLEGRRGRFQLPAQAAEQAGVRTKRASSTAWATRCIPSATRAPISSAPL